MRRCASGTSCAAFDPVTEASPLVDRYPLCDACLLVASRDIWALRLDYGDLEQVLPSGGGAMTERVSGTSDPGVPLNMTVAALQSDIAHAVTLWEPPVREAAGLRAERTAGVRPGWAVATAVRVIAPRVGVLSALPGTWCYAEGVETGPVLRDGLSAVASLQWLHRLARSALGLTRLVHRLPGECERCGAESLERENGADAVSCAHCGLAVTSDDYRRYVGMIPAARWAGAGSECRHTTPRTGEHGRSRRW